MNRIATFVLGAVGALLLAAPLTGIGSREADAGAGTVKVAVINLEKTLYDTPAGKKAQKDFEKSLKEKQAKLDKQKKALEKAAAELAKQQSVLKPDVLEKKKAELQQKYIELQEVYVALERELAGMRAKLIEDLLDKAAPHVEKLAADEGVDIVVDASAVLWASKTVDLTDKLAKKMK